MKKIMLALTLFFIIITSGCTIQQDEGDDAVPTPNPGKGIGPEVMSARIIQTEQELELVFTLFTPKEEGQIQATGTITYNLYETDQKISPENKEVTKGAQIATGNFQVIELTQKDSDYASATTTTKVSYEKINSEYILIEATYNDENIEITSGARSYKNEFL
tara:strand:+ start:384 stop:869 length:486 start_codon:yes stop_codon:yes gene_type:complete